MPLPPGPLKQPRYGVGPIYDANGKLVSFTEHANAIMQRLNQADEMEKALQAAAKTMRNARGAIESNQVVDKEADKTLKRGETAIKDLLKGFEKKVC